MMYQLIESNGKEIKEVWKDYNIIWRPIPQKEFELFNATIKIDGNSIIVENMPEEALSMLSQYNLNDFKEKFGAIQIINTMYDTSSISFLYVSAFANRLTMVSKKIADSLKRDRFTEQEIEIKLFYGHKTIPEEIPPVNSEDTESPASSEADVAPEPETEDLPSSPTVPTPLKKAFATPRLELFNSVNSISVTGVGRDWGSFEIEGVEIEKSDGTQYYNDFTITNRDRVQAIIQATGLGSYSIGYYSVKKFK